MFFIALMLVKLGTAVAQPIWTQVGGPEGGLISEVTIDSAGNILVGTFFGGAFESTDHGENWHARNDGITNFHIRPKGLTATYDNYLFAITDIGGMYRLKREPNAQWQRIDTSLTFGVLLTVKATPLGTILVVTGQNGILRSIDRGETWTKSSNGMDTAGGVRLDAIAIVPGYAAVVTRTGHVFASIDDGLNWSLIGQSPTRTASMHVTSDRWIYIGGLSGEIYRSSNGTTWDKVYQEPNNRDIWSIFASPKSGDVYAWLHSGKLIRSSNRGDNWVQLDSITSGGDFYPTGIDPDGRIFVGSDFDGMFRSTDGGSTLDTINHGLSANLCINATVNPEGDVFSMTERYVFRSTDRGADWAQIFSMKESDTPIPNPMLHDSLGNLYVGTDVGVWKSTDKGDLWKHVFSSPVPDETVDSRALAISNAGVLYLGSGLGLFQSVNEGTNWRELNGPWNETPDKEVKTVIMGNNGRLYWSDYGGSLYWSDDDLFTYQQRGLQGGGVEAVDHKGIMYASNNADVVMSVDSGMTWTVLKPAEGISPHKVFSVMLDHAENLIISTDSGIYRIAYGDENYNWVAVSDGLSTAAQARWSAVTRTVEDVRHDHIFYAAGRGQGMFRSKPNLSEVKRTTEYASNALRPNFPNPFSASTTIHFDIISAGTATLEVFDATGNQVYSRTLGTLPPGEYQTVFQGASLPTGSYPYIIRTASGLQNGVMTITH
jgi:photosystem II stability/assembly factor-like uncharacterized protein